MKQKKVLIIEDELPMLRILKDQCIKANFNVLEARNGKQGLKISLKYHPDAIILDLLMPRMDGITMLGKLRENIWGKTVPVIILTNLDPNNRVLESLKKDYPEDYLMKCNIKIEDVINKIKEVTKEPKK